MSVPNVFIATDSQHPELFWDDQRLAKTLAQRDVQVRAAVWTDTSEDWAAADLVLVRSCWDSHTNPTAFLDWLSDVEQKTTVINDPRTIRWCFDKTYLKELNNNGVDIVPTYWLEQNTNHDLEEILRATGWQTALIKPAISGDGYQTHKMDTSDKTAIAQAQRVVDQLIQDRIVLLQPYLEAFDDGHETSVVFVDGQFSHAYRRPSLLVHGERRAASLREAVSPSEAVMALARQAIAHAPRNVWARVDVVETPDPLINELEVIDPNLRMDLSPNGSCYERIADSVVAILANNIPMNDTLRLSEHG